jgi:hypothetical protein
MKKPLGFACLLVIAIVLSSCGGGGSSTTSESSGGSGGTGDPGGGTGGTGTGTGTPGQSSACSALSVGLGGSLGGFRPFPNDNAWNLEVSSVAVDSNSTSIINDFVGASTGLHADFGSGQYQGSNIGIPYTVVDGNQALADIHFTAYGDESDPGPMPVPPNAAIEGDPNPGSGDRHVLVLDKDNCFLYELYSSYPGSNGSWNAASAAVWDLLATEQRPWGWTSADAAGLPIIPGLARYDEVAAGEIKHALRFTLSQSSASVVLPATHFAGSSNGAPPMGMRMRLKSSFYISTYPANVKVILTAMKKYGLILADNGSPMYISGAPDSRWNNDDLHTLSQVPASAFDVLQLGTVYTESTIPNGAPPAITSFTETGTSGGSVTLSWSATNASYFVVSPGVGAIRGNSAVVTPAHGTTYTLYATNPYGRTIATATVP